MTFFNFARKPAEPPKPPASSSVAQRAREDEDEDPAAAFEIAPEELEAKLQDGSFDGVQLVDVREPHEWATARLAGALHIPLRQVPARVQEIVAAAAGKPVITYCAHGMRSLNAAVFLRQSGAGDVLSLRGGLAQWQEECRPGAETGTAPAV